VQENSFEGAAAVRPKVIEVSGEPLGVVVPHEDGYRFLAVRLPAFAIDGQVFATVDAARLAVTEAVKSGDADAA